MGYVICMIVLETDRSRKSSSKWHTMEVLVIKEDMVFCHVLLQYLTRCLRRIFSHARAKDARVRHQREIDVGCTSHCGWSGTGRFAGWGSIQSVLRS